MNATVSILTQIPASLHDCKQDYLQQHPDWDEKRLLAAAVSLFLLQHGDGVGVSLVVDIASLGKFILRLRFIVLKLRSCLRINPKE